LCLILPHPVKTLSQNQLSFFLFSLYRFQGSVALLPKALPLRVPASRLLAPLSGSCFGLLSSSVYHRRLSLDPSLNSARLSYHTPPALVNTFFDLFPTFFALFHLPSPRFPALRSKPNTSMKISLTRSELLYVRFRFVSDSFDGCSQISFILPVRHAAPRSVLSFPFPSRPVRCHRRCAAGRVRRSKAGRWTAWT